VITKKTQHVLKAILIMNVLSTTQAAFAGLCLSRPTIEEQKPILKRPIATQRGREVRGFLEVATDINLDFQRIARMEEEVWRRIIRDLAPLAIPLHDTEGIFSE